MTVDDLTNAYMVLRNERERLSAEFRKADNTLAEDQAKIEAKLLDICAQQNVDGMRTAHGTVIRSIKPRVHVIDWDNFYQYIMDHNAPQLLQKRVHETNFAEFISERRDEGLPPGVNMVREYTITVRKPSSKDTTPLVNEVEVS